MKKNKFSTLLILFHIQSIQIIKHENNYLHLYLHINYIKKLKYKFFKEKCKNPNFFNITDFERLSNINYQTKYYI